MDSLSVDEIYERFCEPRKTRIERMDGTSLGPEAPVYSVMPAPLVISSDKVNDPRIVISDLGEAWLDGTGIHEELQTPVLFLPPEATFAKNSIGSPADVWSLGCSLYEILGERSLFEGFMPDKDDIIAEMVSTLGPLPQKWWDAWLARGDFFHEDGQWKSEIERSHDSKSRPLLLRIQEMGRENDAEFSADEAVSLEKMLGSMFTYEPAKRATAGDVVGSDWMRRWGLPALQKFNPL